MSITAEPWEASDVFDITTSPDETDRVRGFTFIDVKGTLEDPRRRDLIRSTGLLTARHRPALDAITHLAADVTDAHAAIVSLVDADRQVFPSFHQPGSLEEAPTETPISHSFCKYVVMNDAPLVVEDARTHPVLASHPAVLEGLLVSYAGFPVHAPDGEVLGALCAIDMRPRTWSPTHLSGLQDLATSVDTKIALRLSRRERRLDHDRLMHVLDGASHTLILMTDREGVITDMNRAAVETLTPPRNDMATPTLFDLMADQAAQDDGLSLDQAHDWVLRQADGDERIFSVRVSALRDAEGDLDGYVVVGDDVSARRQAEALLRDTVTKQAAAVARLEALEAERRTFIATASHELRTPVTSILGYTELLEDGHGGDLAPPQRKLVDRLMHSGRRLQHLIEDLLVWDRIGPGHREECGVDIDVEGLVDEVLESLRVHLTGRDLQLFVEMGPGTPPVTGDALQLERALLNLLTNAVKFTPDGGTVRLRVTHGRHGVSFEVSDTGHGICEADQRAVFEPFFRTREAHTHAVPGSGLGLAVVARIVEAHGGRVDLSSEAGKGTTVRFTLAASTQH